MTISICMHCNKGTVDSVCGSRCSSCGTANNESIITVAGSIVTIGLDEKLKAKIAEVMPGSIVWTDHPCFDPHQYSNGDCAVAFSAGETAGRVKLARELEKELFGVNRNIVT